MKNMFENYDNLQDHYVPNNLNKAFPEHLQYSKLTENRPNKPFEMFDDMGNLVGYFWYYGDTITLAFDITGQYTVENNAIVSTITEEAPSTSTVGTVGQRYYNIVDKNVWECTSVNNSVYTWTELDWDETEASGLLTRDVYINASDYLNDCIYYFKIFNFRNEVVYEKAIQSNNETNISQFVSFDIDEELSKKLMRGTYTVSLVAQKDISYITLFDNSDATFLVK